MPNFYCPNCGGTFDEYAEVTERMGEGYETFAVCPKCYETGFRGLDSCPTCNGWKQVGDRLCEKCRGRVRHMWGTFLRTLTLEEIEWLQDEVDGSAWEEFR